MLLNQKKGLLPLVRVAHLRNLPREHYQRWLDEEYQLSDIWLQQAAGGVAWLGEHQPVKREGSQDAGQAE